MSYEWIELSPRPDFLEWFKAPRVYPDRIKTFRKALSDANVGIAALLAVLNGYTSADLRNRAGAGAFAWRARRPPA